MRVYRAVEEEAKGGTVDEPSTETRSTPSTQPRQPVLSLHLDCFSCEVRGGLRGRKDRSCESEPAGGAARGACERFKRQEEICSIVGGEHVTGQAHSYSCM